MNYLAHKKLAVTTPSSVSTSVSDPAVVALSSVLGAMSLGSSSTDAVVVDCSSVSGAVLPACVLETSTEQFHPGSPSGASRSCAKKRPACNNTSSQQKFVDFTDKDAREMWEEFDKGEYNS